ncbi:MAG: multiple sugar transport system permease protein [Thermomicrobiales bacterium]|nr:multiple sugar transport system permease protein [Thermomicrobiales bacterium]MEA2526626.1 multiple sugar transport system permease protein [Thermomicrobiales bacterium]
MSPASTPRHSELVEESLSDPSHLPKQTLSTPGQTRKRAEWLAVHTALLLVIVAFGAPFLWIVAAALNRAEVTSWPWPNHPTLANFRVLFDERDAGLALRNSLIVSGSTMVLATVSASLAGYGLSRMTFRRKAVLVYAILLLQSIPLAVTMVPIYDLATRLELQDTYRGLILTHTAISLPLLVWLMKGFCDAVPRDTEEAAWLDGASAFRGWRDVVLPQTYAGIAVVAGFAFANAWAEVLMVVILVKDVAKETLPFQFFYAADGGRETQTTAALGVLYVLPVLLLFLALRRLMVRGLVESTQGL